MSMITDKNSFLFHSLIFECLYTTELAALAAYDWVGKGNSHEADQAAVKAMRHAFDRFPFSGRVVMGEGERDQAPMLYAGETFGKTDHELAFDVALDPLEGTALTANHRPDAITILALAPRGSLLYAPDIYMEKFAASCAIDAEGFSFDHDIIENVKLVAQACGKPLHAVRATCLDRTRHQDDIDNLRSAGVQVSTFQDGDIKACTSVALHKGVDVYFGMGGAPEGVISACILQSLGGTFKGRLRPRNAHEHQRLKETGITDPDLTYDKNDLAKPDAPIIVAATNVTRGSYPAPLNQAGVEIDADADRVAFHSTVFHYSPAGLSNWASISREHSYKTWQHLLP